MGRDFSSAQAHLLTGPQIWSKVYLMNFASNINERAGIDDAIWGMYEPDFLFLSALKWLKCVASADQSGNVTFIQKSRS